MIKHDIEGTKDIEFLVEEEKLEETTNIIAEETLSYINKRKFVTESIIEQRKIAIAEYKDDEDRLIEYFDHETYIKEESFKMIDRKLREFTILKDSPYFGKINYTDKEFDEVGEMYVGRFGVTPEGSFEPAVVDWRAPIASLFYHGSLGDATYEAPSGEIEVDITGRRQLIIKKAQLEGLFDSAIDVKDEILQMVLSTNTSEKLKDIIMTIQAEQDKIIRLGRTKNIIVNGVAGSGKTTIALHRVAYLLYNNRVELEGKVLILGPNSIFMDYISQVLPSLGEVGVKQETFLGFAVSEIAEDLKIMPYEEYLEEVVTKGSNMLEKETYKNSYELIKDLDKYAIKLSNGYFDIRPVMSFDEEVVGVEEIKELFDKHYAYMPLFKRAEKIKRILTSKIKDKRDEKFRELIQDIKEQKDALSSEELAAYDNDIEFKRKLKVREIVQEVMDSRKALDEWIITESCVSIYKKFNNSDILTINDLAPILYLMIKLEGKKASKDYRHVVIDEAQDYSPLQFKVIRELIGSKYFTVVGDVNQRLVKYSDKAAMLELAEIFNDVEAETYNLNNSYRSTSEIMEYANLFLKEDKIVPLVREGDKVEVVKTSDIEVFKKSILDKIRKLNAQGLESVAIITRNSERLEKVWDLLKSDIYLAKFNSEDVFYKGGNVIIPAYFAKGLEFDGVIIADFEEDIKEDDLIKYIMSTRALHSLSDIVLTK